MDIDAQANALNDEVRKDFLDIHQVSQTLLHICPKINVS